MRLLAWLILITLVVYLVWELIHAFVLGVGKAVAKIYKSGRLL